ncbi:MAG: hypothetical protein ABMA00_18145 [Gemmatimonas sp.]
MSGRLRSVSLLVCLVAALPMQAAAQRAAATPPGPVLFICEHGTVKSLLAMSLFDRYAKEVGLNMRAVSRGTAVDSVVPPWMQSSLAADKFVLGTWRPQALQTADLISASYVVSFDVPASVSNAAKAPRVRWDSLPSVSQNYSAGRDAISSRVRRLVDSLKRAHR